MLGSGRPFLHRVCDSVSGVNWRPTRFVDELVAARYACCVCHVIPSTTVVLPCGHALCGQCQRGCATQDGGNVCPLDGEPFCEDECQKLQLPERRKQKLEAHCWNEVHGCDFVGPLAALLGHFEAECSFHALPCERCGGTVRNSELAAHYIGGCSNAASSVTLGESSGQSCAVVTSGDVTTVGRELEKLATNVCEDAVPALQSQLNELTEAARMQGAQLQEVNAALAASLETLNANVALAAQKFSEAVGEASEMQKRMLACEAGESCLARKSVAGSAPESMHLPEVTSTLRNLEHFTGELLQCLERLVQVQMKESRPTVQVFLLPQSIDEPTGARADSSSPSCANVNETIYHVILSHPGWKGDCTTCVTRLHRRNAWFTMVIYRCERPTKTLLSLKFAWSCKENNRDLPKVVRVTELRGHDSRDFEKSSDDDWGQTYSVKNFSWGGSFVLEIAIRN
ncbi:uncharacterized protein [Dermacentor andersoni]|uniref:uncharacterized protein n=1 Tax=Dermacentor andersoni TaxID=34620 RepID=UPI0024163B6C|nr:TNF receptor-associated factor 6-like [Dermacentor andersoni]